MLSHQLNYELIFFFFSFIHRNFRTLWVISKLKKITWATTNNIAESHHIIYSTHPENLCVENVLTNTNVYDDTSQAVKHWNIIQLFKLWWKYEIWCTNTTISVETNKMKPQANFHYLIVKLTIIYLLPPWAKKIRCNFFLGLVAS